MSDRPTGEAKSGVKWPAGFASSLGARARRRGWHGPSGPICALLTWLLFACGCGGEAPPPLVAPPPVVTPEPAPIASAVAIVEPPRTCDPADVAECARQCDAGDGPSCASLGASHYDGKNGVEKDMKRAAGFFERACAAHVASACEKLAEQYVNGRGVDVDHAKALASWTQACELGSGDSCANAGSVLSGVRWKQPKDPPAAAGFYKRGCDVGHPVSCAALARAMAAGEGVPRDEAAAIPLFVRACEGKEDGACLSLADMYFAGRGVAADPARGRAICEDACEHSRLFRGNGCVHLARVVEKGVSVPPDEKEALRLYERACELADGEGCLELGRRHQSGKGFPKDDAAAFEYFEKGRRHGWSEAWVYVGEAHRFGRGTPKDLKKAVEALEVGCNAGYDQGCIALGEILEKGAKDVPQSDAAAAAWYQRSCKRGVAAGCGHLGVLTAAGRGVAKDLAQAKELLVRACTGGDAPSCAKLKTMR